MLTVGSAFLIGTNVFLLGPVLLAVWRRYFFDSVVFFIAFCTSVLYHCSRADLLDFRTTEWWAQWDYVGSHNAILWLIIRWTNLPGDIGHGISVVALLLLCIFSEEIVQTPIWFLVIFLFFLVTCVFVVFVLHAKIPRLDIPCVILAVVFILIGEAFLNATQSTSSLVYEVCHSLWHVFGPIGLTFGQLALYGFSTAALIGLHQRMDKYEEGVVNRRENRIDRDDKMIYPIGEKEV